MRLLAEVNVFRMANSKQQQPPTGRDPVIEVVKTLNAGYENTDYAKRSPVKLGGANVYTVVFKGKSGTWYENYVYERGEKRIAYWNLADMLMARDNDLIPSGANLELIRMAAVIAFTLLFGAATIYIVVTNQDNKSLQILTGVVGLGLGWLVGSQSTSHKLDLKDRDQTRH
jgi:hypothetical protein